MAIFIAIEVETDCNVVGRGRIAMRPYEILLRRNNFTEGTQYILNLD